MSARRKKKGNSAGTICISFIVMAFLVIISIQIYKLHQRDEAYAAREQELQKQYEYETERQAELLEYEAYTKTTEFIEEIAKSKLGLAYDNEIIFKEKRDSGN